MMADSTVALQAASGYSSSQQYPVVFLFHPLGSTAEQARNIYGIRTSTAG
jgi:hypothetical protein